MKIVKGGVIATLDRPTKFDKYFVVKFWTEPAFKMRDKITQEELEKVAIKDPQSGYIIMDNAFTVLNSFNFNPIRQPFLTKRFRKLHTAEKFLDEQMKYPSFLLLSRT